MVGAGSLSSAGAPPIDGLDIVGTSAKSGRSGRVVGTCSRGKANFGPSLMRRSRLAANELGKAVP